MNLINRIQGVFFNPQVIFKHLAERPVWLDVLIILLIVYTLYGVLIAPYQQQDQYNLMKDNVKLRDRIGEEEFDRYMEKIKNPPSWQRYVGYGMVPITLLIGSLISSLFILILGRMGATEGKFIQVFSAYVHAQLIDKILGNAVRLFLILSRKSLYTATTSVAMFFPELEATSSTYIILSQIDFFQIWTFGILAFGLAAIFKISLKRALFISYLFWAIKCLLYIGFTLLSVSMIS